MDIGCALRTRGPRREQGSAMVLTLVTLSSMAMLASALAVTSLASTKAGRAAKEELSARYVAEAGLSQSVAALRAGGTGAIGSTQAPIAYGAGQFVVARTDPAADTVRLTSTGSDDRGTSRLELTLRREIDSIWRYGAFGDDSLHMDSNARVDSYDSTAGTYASQALTGSGSSQYADDEGDVGSNGSITMESNSKVWGDAVCGPSSTTTVTGNAVVTGSTTPASGLVALPSITVPSLTSLGNLTVSGTQSLAPGQYRYGNLRVNASAVLNVTGPATIVVTNFEVRSNAQFRIAASGGPVEVYVIDDFIVNSNALLASTDYAPYKLNFTLISDNIIDPGVVVSLDDIEFDSNAKMHGTIYAPNALIEMDSNFELFGAVIARRIDLDSNSRVHFDESLAESMGDGDFTWERVCWRELAD